MNRLLRRLALSFVFLVLSGFLVNVFAGQTLPTASFRGHLATDATSLSLTTNPIIINVKYLDGTLLQANNVAESIIGATVSITGATRATDPNPLDTIYPFTNATLQVKASDGFVYVSATVTNVEIVDLQDGFGTVAINPGLDANNPATLNLTNIVLVTDSTHPSLYVNEWQTTLGGSTVAGMSIVAITISGNVSGVSDSDISLGILDGSPPVAVQVPGVRSMGFWKTHEDERNYYASGAEGIDNAHLDVFADANDLISAVQLIGKKTMIMKARQQLAALLLNIAQGLSEATLLTDPQKQNVIDPSVTTVGAAVNDIEAVIKNPLSQNYELERIKDLAESINTDE